METPKTPPGNVPCNGCTACCRGQTVTLFEAAGDDPRQYKHGYQQQEWFGQMRSVAVLQRKPDDSCIYLDDEVGCTIHDRRPYMCRTYDCRTHFLQYTRPERRELIRTKRLKPEMMEAGKARLDTLAQ